MNLRAEVAVSRSPTQHICRDLLDVTRRLESMIVVTRRGCDAQGGVTCHLCSVRNLVIQQLGSCVTIIPDTGDINRYELTV